MRVLVSGGTGFIGSHVVAELLARAPDVAVRVLSRRVHPARPWGRRVEILQGSVLVPGTLAPALASVDAVVHCVQFAGNPVEDAAEGRTWAAVDAGGTRNLAAAAAAAGCRRIVYLSAAGAGGSAPWLRAKAVAEQAVAASGLAYTVLRPAWVYGPGDRTLTRLLRAMRRLPAVPIVGSGRRRVQPVSVLDVAAVAVRAAFDEGATARVLALAGPETLAIDAVARIVQCALGARRPLVHVPVGLARALAGLAFALPGRRSAPGAIDFEVSENLVDPEPAARLFGIELERFEPVLRRLVAAGRL